MVGISIGVIFGAVNFAKSMAEFSGLIESIGSKIDQLAKAKLSAGLRALDQAASSDAEHIFLLREARGFLNEAVGLEVGYRLVVTHLASAVCHYWLEDKENAEKALASILKINPIGTFRLATGASAKLVKTTFEDVKDNQFWGWAMMHPAVFSIYNIYKHRQLVISNESRREFYRDTIMHAINANQEAKAIYDIQCSVATYLSTPIYWIEEITT